MSVYRTIRMSEFDNEQFLEAALQDVCPGLGLEFSRGADHVIFTVTGRSLYRPIVFERDGGRTAVRFDSMNSRTVDALRRRYAYRKVEAAASARGYAVEEVSDQAGVTRLRLVAKSAVRTATRPAMRRAVVGV